MLKNFYCFLLFSIFFYLGVILLQILSLFYLLHFWTIIISVRYCNSTTKIIIFKTRHGPHKFLSSAIPFINELQQKKIQLSTIYTGASLFQCYKFIQVILHHDIICFLVVNNLYGLVCVLLSSYIFKKCKHFL